MDRITNGGSVVTENGKSFWKRREFLRHTDDTVFVITPKYHQNPDLLAYELYGNSKYEWLILQYNNITNPWKEFITGKSIQLMQKARVINLD